MCDKNQLKIQIKKQLKKKLNSMVPLSEKIILWY